mmetsp:Transcript_6603/g.13364  ORF Transcript_6603/g.13364 Transcript_6603/m.13364 type:complete len:511 (-) Transcript_6603:890-2422(-)|eukprot:CAMPEP_0184681478 /NCGR_PEP_ID=MMETSP0312-20130426/4471_1 /TAXON_ID=31354 /ORGANISM="Compsopogon coeruleus, Strain SAG 36.94" /LENGTH=510 /DNA_ID=CAMNT_0027132359 /DNA_START=9 /DNA_END=1541 /DNA_ORIENTATION=-
MGGDTAQFGFERTEVIFQGFNWQSSKRGGWYRHLSSQVDELASMGITVIWCPPPTDSLQSAPEGYMPRDLEVLDSKYGSRDELVELVKRIRASGMIALADTVLNHRCASKKSSNGAWTQFGGKYAWDDRAIIGNDPSFPGRGHSGTGVPISIAPNIDHRQDFVKRDIIDWLNTLRKDIGFDAYRIDYARGFSGEFVKGYVEATNPIFAVGEMWDGLEYDGSYMRPNQERHRQRICDWINSTGQKAMAFDFTTKGVLMQACRASEYWRLKDGQGNPAGVLGVWPEKSVSFIDNHDTGSTQAHWPFPNDKVMQGYAYILLHPGIPCVFYDHVFDWKLKNEIKKLIELRKHLGICNQAKVLIERADNSGYIARVSKDDDSSKQAYLKLGHVQWAPSAERGWTLWCSGHGYAVWTRDGIPQQKPEPSLRRQMSQVAPFLPVLETDELEATNVTKPKPLKPLTENLLTTRFQDTNGKKKLILEYEFDVEDWEDTNFSVTLEAVRGDSNEMLKKSL